MPAGLNWAQELEKWRAWDAEDKARRWLAVSTRYAQFARQCDDEILDGLCGISSHEDPVGFLDAYCRLVKRRSREFQRATARELARLAADHQGRGADAVVVDRAIRRLLHRLPEPVGRPVALTSVRSSRRARRSAAWKFYRVHRLDDESCNILVAQFETDQAHEEYVKLVASDQALVLPIGADAVLRIAPNYRYWRTQVIEAVLSSSEDDADRFRLSHPAEWLWAVGRCGDETLVPSVLAFLSEYQDDVDVCEPSSTVRNGARRLASDRRGTHRCRGASSIRQHRPPHPRFAETPVRTARSTRKCHLTAGSVGAARRTFHDRRYAVPALSGHATVGALAADANCDGTARNVGVSEASPVERMVIVDIMVMVR